MEPKIETTLEEMKKAYDWSNYDAAMSYAEGFTLDDVAEVIASVEGMNDEASWVAVFLLKDGRYAGIDAGCDYTGWD